VWPPLSSASTCHGWSASPCVSGRRLTAGAPSARPCSLAAAPLRELDVTYTDGGVEDTFAPELTRTDQMTIGEAGAAVHVGETVIHFADDAYITPGEARMLAEAVVELADFADGRR
jgi:hypothetical protein